MMNMNKKNNNNNDNKIMSIVHRGIPSNKSYGDCNNLHFQSRCLHKRSDSNNQTFRDCECQLGLST